MKTESTTTHDVGKRCGCFVPLPPYVIRRTCVVTRANVGSGLLQPCPRSRAFIPPQLLPAYHRYHRVKGGFLSVELRAEGQQSLIAFQLRDVRGTVVYEAKSRRAVT